MEWPTEYYAQRASADRVAELHREADAFRLTRVLAGRHADAAAAGAIVRTNAAPQSPGTAQARPFGAGVTRFSVRPLARARRAAAIAITGRPTRRSQADPCPC